MLKFCIIFYFASFDVLFLNDQSLKRKVQSLFHNGFRQLYNITTAITEQIENNASFNS